MIKLISRNSLVKNLKIAGRTFKKRKTVQVEQLSVQQKFSVRIFQCKTFLHIRTTLDWRTLKNAGESSNSEPRSLTTNLPALQITFGGVSKFLGR